MQNEMKIVTVAVCWRQGKCTI